MRRSHTEAKLGPLPGEAGRGAYLSWPFYYRGVMEPLIILHRAGLSHPALTASLRDLDTMTARLAEALSSAPWLLGDRFSAADMLCSSPFAWFPDLMPDDPAIQDWIALCAARMSEAPSSRRQPLRTAWQTCSSGNFVRGADLQADRR